ncbi:Lrp/AsnC family transcriptional regulator [Fusibacter tunisiensis]|uniref:Lrp/AsnC family leucine-responsive transcriptional regulator n=1 Tax=Fusibacter tunisiensis TaxID=1008308 RepID=A0ABS2MMN8_9FIRM|nr:Lrp/AsnC family transcriptional regulator [Fusibacter tunisiensis]MBM7560670.1 Lrp/AsnC family leucine-responsive transcriptional regulator [Fusibacter tunisiensis]
MDATDFKILKILQNNGRISMKELGQRVNLTSPAVSERVKRLEENGVIEGYSAVINPKKIGLYVEAMVHVGMKVSSHAKFKKFAIEEPSIIECHHVTGEDCMTVKVVCSNTHELEALLDKIQAIGSTKTSIILSSPLKRKAILPFSQES